MGKYYMKLWNKINLFAMCVMEVHLEFGEFK